MIKTILRAGYQRLWLARYVLPINEKKVAVVSYYGRGFSDNPKYIIERLHRQRPDLKIYWAVKDDIQVKKFPKYVTPVKQKSIAYVYHSVTAKFWIDNCRKPYYEKKRKSQIYIQTWHGGNACLKKIERHAEEKLSNVYVRNAKHDATQTDLMVSGSRFFDNCYREAFWYPDGEILSVGSPRNDIFFDSQEGIKSKVRKSLEVDDDTRIVLYAPTFRTDHSIETYLLNFQAIKASYESRFGGKWKVAVRLHPNVANESSRMDINKLNCVVDATRYDDMQELLVACDSLITDYSSSVFDYILTKRPIFILATDYEAYEQERGVYFDLKTLLFPYSDTEKGLNESIKNFDEEVYRKECELFMHEHEFYDIGQASDSVVAWICDKL